MSRKPLRFLTGKELLRRKIYMEKRMLVVRYRKQHPEATLQQVADVFGVTRQAIHEVLVKESAPTCHVANYLCKCKRCEYYWSSRMKKPIACPHCNSPDWNKAQRKK